MGWVIVGGVLALYFAASLSRKRKQKIVQHALSRAVRDELAHLYRDRFGTRDSPITSAETNAMASRYFHSLLELFGARDFASLMRAMTLRQDDSWTIEKEVVDRLVSMVPGTTDDPLLAGTEWSRIDRALTRAGETATATGRMSGEI